MGAVIKGIGLVCWLSAAVGFGWERASRLERRVKALDELMDGVSLLYDRMQFGGQELWELLPLCFGSARWLTVNGQEITAKAGTLTEGDRSLCREFFGRLGTGVRESEGERLQRFFRLLEDRRRQAVRQVGERAKLWRTFGWCIGLAGCLLL